MELKDITLGMRVRRIHMLNPSMQDVPQIGATGTVADLPETPDDTLVGVWWDGFTHGHCNDLFGEHKERLDGWFVRAYDMEPIPHDLLQSNLAEAEVRVMASGLTEEAPKSFGDRYAYRGPLLKEKLQNDRA